MKVDILLKQRNKTFLIIPLSFIYIDHSVLQLDYFEDYIFT